MATSRSTSLFRRRSRRGLWTFEDLELDVYLTPSGSHGVVDVDEFLAECDSGQISVDERGPALQAAGDIERMLKSRTEPFGVVGWSRCREASTHSTFRCSTRPSDPSTRSLLAYRLRARNRHLCALPQSTDDYRHNAGGSDQHANAATNEECRDGEAKHTLEVPKPLAVPSRTTDKEGSPSRL